MTQWMRQAVDDVYRQLSLPEDWSPEHKERYLQTLTVDWTGWQPSWPTRWGPRRSRSGAHDTDSIRII
ncbi:hypothetical protein [Mycobacterium riyadhense]|uniref:hypothetical protein n=1 Tax=Mycobacterium riyadhense TaxID=486698 RepID=UPI0019523D47|nr:hypothetical protein [Mycobacterium riyadhense]